jgi:hypothetical protein
MRSSRLREDEDEGFRAPRIFYEGALLPAVRAWAQLAAGAVGR